jgi:hypothetical protein
MSGVLELCLLPGARLRLGCARRRSGPGLAGVVLEPARVGCVLGFGVMLGVGLGRWWLFWWFLTSGLMFSFVVAPSVAGVVALWWMLHLECFLLCPDCSLLL